MYNIQPCARINNNQIMTTNPSGDYEARWPSVLWLLIGQVCQPDLEVPGKEDKKRSQRKTYHIEKIFGDNATSSKAREDNFRTR